MRLLKACICAQKLTEQSMNVLIHFGRKLCFKLENANFTLINIFALQSQHTISFALFTYLDSIAIFPLI